MVIFSHWSNFRKIIVQTQDVLSEVSLGRKACRCLLPFLIGHPDRRIRVEEHCGSVQED